MVQNGSEANLSQIADACKFPDWLGYLGLVIHHFGAADNERQLSLSWAAQLKKLVTPATLSHQRLDAIFLSTTRLSLDDLELIEKDWRLRVGDFIHLTQP